MTALSPTRRSGPSQMGLKILASVLTVVCGVLFLLAIEQKQMIEAWAAVRDGAAPMAQRASDWVSSTAQGGASRLTRAVEGRPPPMTATPTDVALAGEFLPVEGPSTGTTDPVIFDGGHINLGSGEILRTRPLRIAAGREVFLEDGQTFAGRLDAADDAQIELRQVVAPEGRRRIAPASLCGDAAPGAVALLHRRDQVDMMIFRERTIIGPDAPVSALCGVWTFHAR